MIAGTLEIQLLANMARLQKDMDDAKRSVGGAMSEISKSVDTAKAALGGLAAGLLGGLSVAGLVSVANRAIDAADAMNDLSQRVGIAVKDLAKYELAASQSGTTMESLAKGIKGLAGNLMEHGDALKKAGITATTADGAMKQLAEVFANMPDGMEKTTLAVKLFGKSGMDLIPMLNMGADGLEKTAEKSAKYAAQMAIMAPLADAYNDNMAEIAMSSKVVGMSIVNDMLPSMVSITGAMAMAAKESGILKAAWVGLGGAMDEFIAKPTSVIFKGFNNTLDEANAKLMRFFGKTAESDKLLAAVARRNKEILDLTDDASAPAAPAAAGFDKAKWLADYKAMMDALGGDEKTKKVKANSAALKEHAERVRYGREAVISAGDALEASNESYQKSLKELTDEREKYIEGLTKSADSIGEQVQKLRDEEQALGISTAQNISLAQALELVAIARLHEEQAKQMSFGDETAAAAIQTEIDKRRELLGLIGSKDAREASAKANADAAKTAYEEWKKTAEKINDSITDALMRGFESGKGFAANLRDTLTNMFKTMILRPTISAIVNPVAQGVTGMMGLSGAANAGGTAGNLASLGGFAGGASAFGGAFSAGAALGTEAFSAGLTMMTEATGASSFMAGAGQALGAIGPAGWAALAAVAVLSLQDHGKPTSSTGDAFASFDAQGNRTAYQAFFDGSSAAVDKMLTDLQSSYASAAKALGIGTVASEFAYGGNTGKNGESPNFAMTSRAGNYSFTTGGETASSDAAISLAASRAVFAALQGSDLPAYLAKVFNGVTADALSQEQITNTLAYAASLKQVRDALLETREPLQILKDNVAQGTAALSTSAETFKTDFVAALDSGITPDKLAQWQGLQGAMDQLAQASGKATEAVKDIGRSIADIASERTRLQDQLDELTMTSTQLLDKQRNAIDGSNKSLFDQVQAATSAKAELDKSNQSLIDQAQAAKDFVIALTAANSALDASRQGVASAYNAIQTAAANAANAVGAAQGQITTGYLAAQDAVASAQANITNLLDQSAKALSGFSSTIGQFLTQIATTDLGANSKAGQLAALKADFAITSAQAKAGDAGALGAITGKASALLTAGKQQSATALDFARLSASVSNTLSGIADAVKPTGGSASADPMVKAQQDLAKAQADLAKWSDAAAVSGASTARATTDYLAEWRKASAISASAQADLLAAQKATAGIELSALPTAIDSLRTAIDAFNTSLTTQLGAMAQVLATMTISGTGGTAASAATYKGADVAQAVKDYAATGATTAQTVATASTGYGVTSGDLAKVAAVAGATPEMTALVEYQKRIDATTALSALERDSVVAEANRRAGVNSTSAQAEFVKYLLSIGWNAGMGDKAMGWGNGTTNAWATANGFPAFVNGGSFGGGIRLVGENGPELEATGPSRIFNASQTRSMLQSGGADNSELVAEMRMLRAICERQQAALDKIERSTRNTDTTLRNVTPSGDSLQTVAA